MKWFSTSGVSLEENRRTFGRLSYSHFSAGFNGPQGRLYSSHGCATDRGLAAIKCAAEYIERDYTLKFFHRNPSHALASRASLKLGRLHLAKAELIALPPSSLWTSNGWAVHRDQDSANQAAYFEALERHLLLKSFFKFGWDGFREVHRVEGSDPSLYFLVSRYISSGFVSGLVIAKSSLYPGVSLGYTVGAFADIQTSEFWESAVFEAVTKIFALDGASLHVDSEGSWLEVETKYFLETPFDERHFEFKKDLASMVEDVPQTCNLMSVDLSGGVDLPIYGAFAWGGTMIPLVHRSAMGPSAYEYLAPVFKHHDLSLEIPERHPII